MKVFVLAMTVVSFACSGSDTRPSTLQTTSMRSSRVINPISAPSMALMEDGSAPKATHSAPSSSRVINFTDAKFAVTLPSADWKVKVMQQGVVIFNDKTTSMVSLHLSNDTRPLKVIAEAERVEVKSLGRFTLSDVRTADNPERASFLAIAMTDDGATFVMMSVFMRNPGNPKETLAMFGLWIKDKPDARAETLGIIGSVSPIQ